MQLPMTFLCQIYLDDKQLEFASTELRAIQLYSCFSCHKNSIAELDQDSKLNQEHAGNQLSQLEFETSIHGTYSRILWNRFTYWRDINWIERSDPAPSTDIERFWDDGEIRPEYVHLLADKIGGCFPTVDHGGTTSFEQEVVAQLDIGGTVYITRNDDSWDFFRY